MGFEGNIFFGGGETNDSPFGGCKTNKNFFGGVGGHKTTIEYFDCI